MPQQRADLDEFNTPEVLRVVWETFAELSRLPKAMDSNTWFSLDGQDSMTHIGFERCFEAGLIPHNVQRFEYPPFKHICLSMFIA